MLKRILSLTVIVCFFLTTLGPLPKAHADTVLGLPSPGAMVNLSPAYEPVMIKGLTVHKDNPFLFDFIVDTGNSGLISDDLKKEGDRLVKYFLACLTIPEKDLWVNLSPYEKDRMVPQALGQTALGRDLLAEDYILKQLTASLIYPEKDLGKAFWDRVYAKARQMYGTTQIPVNTFNKVWIMADKATVYEHGQTVFVLDGHLKVMLEEDYLALKKHNGATGVIASEGRIDRHSQLFAKQSHSIASQIVRQIVLPEIEKEVNTGKNFSILRQIFNSLILASWYKRNLKEALLNQVYSDKSTVKGVNLADPSIKEQIYQQYIKAYKKGVFNYVKEDAQADGRTIPRKYFSGGFVVDPNFNLAVVNGQTPNSQAMIARLAKAIFYTLSTAFLSNAQAPTTSPAASAQTRPIMSAQALLAQVRLLRPAFHAGDVKIGVESKGKISLLTRINGSDSYIFLDNVTGVIDPYRGTPDEGKILIVTSMEGQGAKRTEVKHRFVYSVPVPDRLLFIRNLGFDLSYKSDFIRGEMERYGYFVPTISNATRSRPELFGNFTNIDRMRGTIRLYTTYKFAFDEFEIGLKEQTVAAYFHEVANQAMASAAMDPVESAFMEVENIVNQLRFPNMVLINGFNKADLEQYKEHVQELLRSMRMGAARVLANYIGQEDVNFQDPKTNRALKGLLFVLRKDLFAKKLTRPMVSFKREMDALEAAKDLLQAAVEIENRDDRQAAVSLARQELGQIRNSSARSLRAFLNSRDDLADQQQYIDRSLTEIGQYVNGVHRRALRRFRDRQIAANAAMASNAAIPAFNTEGGGNEVLDVLQAIIGQYAASTKVTAAQPDVNMLFQKVIELKNTDPDLQISDEETIGKIFWLAYFIRVIKGSRIQSVSLLKYNGELVVDPKQSAIYIANLADLIEKGLFAPEALKGIFKQEDIDFYTSQTSRVMIGQQLVDMKTPSDKLLGALRKIGIIDGNNELTPNAAMMVTTTTGVSEITWKTFISNALSAADMPVILKNYELRLLKITKFKDFLKVLVQIRRDMERQDDRSVLEYLSSGRSADLEVPMREYFQSAIRGSQLSAISKAPEDRDRVLNNILEMSTEVAESKTNGELLKSFLYRSAQYLQSLYNVTDAAMTIKVPDVDITEQGVQLGNRVFFLESFINVIKAIKTTAPKQTIIKLDPVAWHVQDPYALAISDNKDLSSDEDIETAQAVLRQFGIRLLPKPINGQWAARILVQLNTRDTLQGMANEITVWLERQVEKGVKDIVTGVLGVRLEEFDPDTTLEELGADSLDMTDIITAFEKKFHVENIPDGEIAGTMTVGDVVDYINKNIDAAMAGRAYLDNFLEPDSHTGKAEGVIGATPTGVSIPIPNDKVNLNDQQSIDALLRSVSLTPGASPIMIEKRFILAASMDKNGKVTLNLSFRDGAVPSAISSLNGIALISDTNEKIGVLERIEPAEETAPGVIRFKYEMPPPGETKKFRLAALNSENDIMFPDNKPYDFAQSSVHPWVQGGIDLNTSNGMQWRDSKDGNGVEMIIDPAMVARVRREGINSLSPVIFKITPVASIWPLVGLQAPVPVEHLASL